MPKTILDLAIERKKEIQSALTTADDRSGAVSGVIAVFSLQVLLLASSGQHWRLRGDGRFSASGLDQPGRATVAVGLEIRSTEEVG